MTSMLPIAPGALIGGDFRIVSTLGAGGMGAVYVAEQASTARRRALKLMHPSLVADAKLRDRFEQEARVGALIPSDHVVQVIAAGVDEESGAPFIAMELLEGEDLAALLRRRGALPAPEVKALFQPLCHALGAAHRAGIVHRDIKPENVFLAQTQSSSGAPTVKVLDFGIAKLTAEVRTMATSAVGTPMWMAPEQTDPRAGITPATDVWALGLLAFAMLTGRHYWRVANEASLSVPALMREMLFEPLVPASARAAELGITEGLPAGLDAWFARCVHREPAARFASATEAWEALGAALDTELVVPAPSSVKVHAASGVTSGPSFAYAPTAAAPSTEELSAKGTGLGQAPTAVAQTGMVASRTDPEALKPVSRRPWVAIAAALLGALGATGAMLLVRSRPPAPPKHLEQEEDSPPPPLRAELPLPPLPPLPSTAAVLHGAPGSEHQHAPRDGEAAPRPRPAPAPTTSAAAAAKPFDYPAAMAELSRRGSDARFLCKGRSGPRAVAATVFFDPSGGVRRVEMAPELFSTDSGMCVQLSLAGARVPPYADPKAPISVPTAVSLD